MVSIGHSLLFSVYSNICLSRVSVSHVNFIGNGDSLNLLSTKSVGPKILFTIDFSNVNVSFLALKLDINIVCVASKNTIFCSISHYTVLNRFNQSRIRWVVKAPI